MPYIDPGVYSTVTDRSQYANLPGPTVFAVVGSSTKGVTNKPIYCYGEADLINKVGAPDALAPDYAVLAAIQFMKRGQKVIFVRVTDGTEATSTIIANDFFGNVVLTLTFDAYSAGTWGDSIKAGIELDESTLYSDTLLDAGTVVATVQYDSIGGGGIVLVPPANLPIVPGSVEIVTRCAVGAVSCTIVDNGLGTLTSIDVPFSAGTIDYVSGELTITFIAINGVTVGHPMTMTHRKAQYSEVQGVATQVDFSFTIPGNPLITYPDTQKIQPDSLFILQGDNTTAIMSTVGSDDGSGAIAGTNIAAGPAHTIDYDTGEVVFTLTAGAAAGPPASLLIIYREPYFQVYVQTPVDKAGNFGEVERFVDVVMDTGSPRYIETVINEGIANEVSKSAYVVVTDEVAPAFDQPMPGLYTLAAGDDGSAGLTDPDYIGAVTLGVAYGMQMLTNPETEVYDILAVPGVSGNSVVQAGIAIVEARKDAIYLADSALADATADVIDWHNGVGVGSAFNSAYGAAYWSWVKIVDSYNTDRQIFIPPSGFVAAQFAHTDNVAYPWDAPAGPNRGVVLNSLGVEYSPTKTERDTLYGYPNAINSMVDFSNAGTVIWGQKTLLRTNTARNRLNVVRMLCYLQRAVTTTVESLVFEQGNETTWTRFKALVDPIVNGIVQSGGLVSGTVLCDASTNPASVIEQNEMRARLVLVPTKTAEKIIIDFVVQSQTSA